MSSAYSLITARSFLRRNGIDPLPQLVLRHYDAAADLQRGKPPLWTNSYAPARETPNTAACTTFSIRGSSSKLLLIGTLVHSVLL